MRTCAVALLVLLQEPPLEKLIEELGSDAIAERDRADAELRRRTRDAVDSLDAALRGARTDSERKRLRAALETLAGGKVLPLGVVQSARVTLPAGARRLGPTLEELSRQSGLPIARDAGPADDDPVLPEMEFKDAPLDAALDRIARKAGGLWIVEGDRIRVSAGGRVALRLFDVSDLTQFWQDEPWLELEPRAGPARPPDDARIELTGEDTANLVRHSVEPRKWEEVDGRSIQFQNGILIIRNEPVILDRIERYLEGLRRKFLVGVGAEVEVFRCAADAKLGDDPLAELRKLASDGKSARRIASFHRIPRDKRRIALVSETTSHLVARYDADGNPAFVPVAAGVRMNLRASLSADGDRVRVELDARLSRLVSVEKRKTDRGEIQSPALESQGLHVDETLEAGRSALLGRVRGPGTEGPLPDIVVVARFTPVRIP